MKKEKNTIIVMIYIEIILITLGIYTLIIVSNKINIINNKYIDLNNKTIFNIGETFENSFKKITLLECVTDNSENLETKINHKIIRAKFEIENTSSNDEYINYLSFIAYADGTQVEQNKEQFKVSETIEIGKKTIGYIFYEVPKDTKEFTIEYNADFWSDGTVIKFLAN